MKTQNTASTRKENIPVVRSVVKAMSLLEIIADKEEIGISELAKLSDLDKSTVYRLLSTLKTLGYVYQNDDNEKYCLTIKLFEVGSLTRDRVFHVDHYRPVLEKISLETRETVHLAVLESDRVVYIDKIDSPRILRMFSRVGGTSPAYCTGLGKILLAYQSRIFVRSMYQDKTLTGYTKTTITDLDSLITELDRIARQGYAYDNEEHEQGIRCIAAPVRNQFGNVVAAISVSGPSIRMDDEFFETYRHLVVDSAQAISHRLGYTESTEENA
jgi:IclR family transcriptional regulator, KDG regulon repressor